MLLSLSNIESLGVPLIDEDVLRKILSSSKKKSAKKASKTKNVSSEELFSKILAEMNVEPPKKTKKKSSREKLFKQILSELNLERENEDDSEDSESSDEERYEDQLVILNSPMRKEFKSKDTSIKIASKEIKDSHYQVDVSKDMISKNGKKLIMISAYIREGYLGRYLMKRNYYYFPKNEKYADDTFAEIVNKVKRIKKSYHEGGIEIKGVTSNVYRIFDGIISDVKFDKEDDLGTNTKRHWQF